MAKFNILEPLKNLEGVASFIHGARDWILALQQKEYDKDTLTYLACRQLTGKPYINDYSHEPDQIIQIKNLSNALYLVEQLFEKLPKIHLSSRTSILGIGEIEDQADEARRLLLNVGVEFEGAFQHEIRNMLSFLGTFKSFTGCSLLKSTIDPTTLTSEKIRSLLKNQGGCIQHLEKIYYFNNKTLKEIPKAKSSGLTPIMNRLHDDVCRMATGSDIEVITNAIGQSPFMSNFFENADPIGAISAAIRKVGLLSGHAIDQMKPATGKLDYTLLSWVSNVLPTYIETMRVGIEQSAATESFSLPNVDKEKMASVLQKKLDKISNAIKETISTVGRIKDPASLITNLPALFTLPSHFQQIQPLLKEILQEVEHLQDTAQHRVHEYLAQLKYEVLPNLFALIDKFEIQLLLEPGRLSQPVMDQIKPMHEMLIQTTSNYLNIKFADKAQQLLKLEDAQFIALRVIPLHQQIDASKKVLHQVELTLQVLNTHLDILNTEQDLLVLPSKATLKAHFTLIEPYLTQLDGQLKQIVSEHLTAQPVLPQTTSTWLKSWFVTPASNNNPALPALMTLKAFLEQMQHDQAFRIKHNQAIIDSVNAKANRVLFEHNKANSIFDVSEKNAFDHRYSLSDTIQFDDQGIITNPDELSADETWDLYQWYDNKLTAMERAEADGDRLLETLKHDQRNKKSPISLHSDYIPCLLGEKFVQHQPNRFYVNIDNGMLKYEVMEPLAATACSLLKLSKVDPQSLDVHQLSNVLGNHDGFIQYQDKVFYFDRIKLISVPLEKILRLKPIMDALPDNEELRIVDTDEPDFNIIASEDIRAVCKLYLMHLDEAKEAGHRNCYVWNREIKQLSYIDVNGQVQDKLTLSAKNKSMLTLFVEKTRILKSIERALLKKKDPQADLSDKSIAKIDEKDSNYRNLTAGNLAGFINPLVCGLLSVPADTIESELKKLSTSNYIRTEYDLFYYNKEKGTLHKIELDRLQLQDFNREFTADKNIEELSPNQLKAITSMTGHAPSRGSHYPGIIRAGAIPLGELNCSLTTLTSITPLKPYLTRVFDKALERGHIHNLQKSQCIRWYSSIQPYLVDAFKAEKRKDIRTFDSDVVNFFSGNVYQEASKPRPTFKFADFRPQLLGLKNELSVKQATLREKRDHYFQKNKDKIFSVETSPIKAIYHPQFSPDVADFMLSIEPVKRQVHESGKTLFRVKLALDHLEKYCRKSGRDNTSFERDNKHYPWLHTWVTQLTSEQLTPTVVTPERLKTHLKKIQFYEEADISRNTRIIESFNKRVSYEPKPCDLSEASAFKHLAPKFKPCLMKEGNALEPNQLHIKITGNQLHYKFLHYGKPQVGKISVDRVKPFDHFDEKTILNKKTLSNILSIIYAQRTSDIESDRALISPDEALELYQWYLSKQVDMVGLSSEEQIILQNKISLYEKYASKSPEFKITESEQNIQPVELESRESHFIKHARFGAELTELKQSIAMHFDNLTDSFKQELNPALIGVPYPDAGTHNPFTEYVQQVYPWLESHPMNFKWSGEELVINALHTVSIPEWIANKMPGELKQLGSTVVHQALMGGIDKYLSVKSYLKPAPEAVILQSPHQVLAYKRLMNIAYFLEQIMHEIEKINDSESKLSRVSHLLVSYLYSADIYPLVVSLSADPHFAPFFQDIVSKVESVIKNISDEGEQYSALEQIKSNTTPIKNATLLYVMNALTMLPERISLKDEVYKEKRRALKASAAKTTANIEKIMNDYQASYLRLFFDLPIILELLKELPNSTTHFATQANIKMKGDLEKTPPEILSKIMIEADDWETTIGLKPGTISIPLKKIMDEFYHGLITPLILDADTQVRLLCDPAPMEKRIRNTESQISSAETELKAHEEALKSIQDIFDACNGPSPSLNQNMYTDALPIFKKAVTGANLHVMSFNDAKIAKLTDCFIWNDQQSQLFYIDSKGRPNPQNTGCDLYLKSISVGQDITEEVLNQPVKMYMPGKEKVELPITAVKKPTLIKQGDNYFIYENSSDGVWNCTALDSDIVTKMHLDFDKTKRLHKNKAYADMYAEITKKTGWTYPIHLKNTHSMIACIRDKKRDQTSASTPLYLSEKEIKTFVTSNSHFVLPRNGVSLPEDAGCCLISMSTIPEKFDDLKLPPDYSAYYVQVNGVYDALYYIDQKTKLIKQLDILPNDELLINSAISIAKKNNPAFDERKLPQDRQRYYILNSKLYIDWSGIDGESRGVEEFATIPNKDVFFNDIVSKIKKNRPMLNADFHTIESLTMHLHEPEFISNLDDFVLNTQNIAQVQSLALNCRSHYEGLCATSKLAAKAAQEQLVFLKKTELEQQASNKDVKKSVFTDYFNKKIDDWCKKTDDLQGYILCLLTESTEIEPDRMYVNINGNKLDYKVIDPTGLKQKGSIELSEIDPSLKQLASVDELRPYLPKILKITAKRGERHTRSHSLAFEYQTKLGAALSRGRDAIIENAMAMKDSDSKSIDEALKNANDEFNKKNLKQYRQLNAANQALDDFMLYLNEAQKQWTTRRSLFESDETIRGKRSTLDHLDALAANDNDEVSVRIKKIQTYLLEEGTLDQLLDYANYESNQFARLFQLVLRLFEKLGLYTPKVVQHVDNLLRPLTEEPTANLPKQTSQYRFFAETTRERIQNKANELKDNNKNEPDSSKNVPKAPS